MSIQFNDTSTLKGLTQLYALEIGMSNPVDLTGNTTKLKQFTADVNVAYDEYLHIAFQASGDWQFDDSNHTDYPIITANLVSGRRDYKFTTDETGNLILDVFKVLIIPSATSTTYSEIYPVDQQTDRNAFGYSDGVEATGTPTTYDKTANAIFLDPIPGYSVTNGLKVFINREGSYFTYTDTTKKPGVPGIHHKWFYVRPALENARRNNLATLPRLEVEVERLKMDIKEYFGRREKDTRNILTMDRINFR